jgi:SAM-dependent methyltransferase
METIIHTHQLNINFEELKNAISDEYTLVVCDNNHAIHFVSGMPLAIRLDYPDEILQKLPEEAIRPFAGVGNPFRVRDIRARRNILDIGSGAGMDSLTASFLTDHKASITGIDMTTAMVEQARVNSSRMSRNNLRYITGQAEDLPFPSETFDLVISNGVINLCVDKEKVYREIYRVLKPGGRFQIADVLLEKPVPAESRNLVHLWTNCVAGAIPIEDYLGIIKRTGFIDIEMGQHYDVFKDARVAKSAAYFGAKGHNITGKKV